MENKSEWERILQSDISETSRLKVEGGHIYAITLGANFTTVFVPDVDLMRYQAHLRDAYKKGYMDGQLEARNPILNRTDIP